MNYFLFLFLFFCSSIFAGGYKAGQESERLPAVFWQRADGRYAVKIIVFDDPYMENYNHIYVFDRLEHAKECPCFLNKSIDPEDY